MSKVTVALHHMQEFLGLLHWICWGYQPGDAVSTSAKAQCSFTHAHLFCFNLHLAINTADECSRPRREDQVPVLLTCDKQN
jgi:hypothetical protein